MLDSPPNFSPVVQHEATSLKKDSSYMCRDCMTQQPSCLTFLDETGFRCGCQVINPCPTYVTCGCLRPNQIQSCLAAVATCMQNCPTQYPSCGMSRSRFVTPCCCMLLVAAVLALADAFVVPSSPHASSARSHINKIDRAEPMISSDACAVFMSVLAGLIVGVALPASSLAGTGGARPDVQVVRPGWAVACCCMFQA